MNLQIETQTGTLQVSRGTLFTVYLLLPTGHAFELTCPQARALGDCLIGQADEQTRDQHEARTAAVLRGMEHLAEMMARSAGL